jgi:hypothetical protein
MKAPVATTIHLNGNDQTAAFNSCVLSNKNICTQAVDTYTLEDGRYEVYAEANGNRSQVKELIVLNHKPEISLSFVRADGKPMSKIFKDRVEFNIDVKATPILPQSISFIATDLNGKIVAERTTDMVVENMRLGFRFNTIPNGTYKIAYIAKVPFNNQIVSVSSNVETITNKN